VIKAMGSFPVPDSLVSLSGGTLDQTAKERASGPSALAGHEYLF
jgi:hypothetical protein